MRKTDLQVHVSERQRVANQVWFLAEHRVDPLKGNLLIP